MKQYSNEELDAKIHTFLNKKFDKYPDLALSHKKAPIFTKPSFPARMMHSLVSGSTS